MENQQIEKDNIWRYEKYGLFSTFPPHKQQGFDNDFTWENKKSPNGKTPYYIISTSEFDSPAQTEWWYCIKDDNFDIENIKSKIRYEIKKGCKNFETKLIDPKDHIDEINSIRQDCFLNYPDQYRKNNNEEQVKKTYTTRSGKWIVIGAFYENVMQGYVDAQIKDGYIDFQRLTVKPKYEKLGINYALVYKLISESQNLIEKGYYICDGQRTIRHKTNFQDWLIKNFGFRKSYCKLNMKVKKPLFVLINIIRPFANILAKSEKAIFYNIYCFIKMYEISRN